MTELSLQHIYKTYSNGVSAVKDFTIDIKDKEFLVLVGPSGCGKSTILRLIAGLEGISEGNILMNGKIMNNVAPKDRDIAFVFQNYALYPHLTVYHNMAFGLKSRKFPKAEIERRIKNAARILNLEQFLHRKPTALSGGQRQRVALGRAIVRDAKLFLMDEPLSNLDAKLRTQMRTEIKKLHDRLQTTFLYVTHDQTEAMTMATRLVVMNNGVIQQIGSPKEVYDHPENVFVGSFIGSPPMNFFKGVLFDGKIQIGSISLSIPDHIMVNLRRKGYVNREIIMGIRPEHLQVVSAISPSASLSFVEARIEVIELLGADYILHAQIAGQPFMARLDARSQIQQGQFLKLAVDMTKVHFFDYQTEQRIYLEG